MTSGSRQVRQHGVLADWKDDRGFGFVQPTDGGPRVFAHISAFPRGRRPIAGVELTYVRVIDEQNRLRASEVRYSGTPPPKARSRSLPAALATSGAFAVVLAVLSLLGSLSGWIALGYLVLSAASFLLYADDKGAAEQGERRTSEARLHFFDLLGGWPGGLVARHLMRHKTRKQPFRRIFWTTAIANAAALAVCVITSPDLSWL